MRKQTVLCVSPDPNDATSFYRGCGPLGEMRKQAPDFDFVPLPKGFTITWSVLQQADWLFLQRPFTEPHLRMAQMAKANGLKVWADWDDDILNIPRCNYTHKIYAARGARKNVTELMDYLDVVTVSTKHLAEIFGSPQRKNVFVVPNALNTYLFPLESRREFLKSKGVDSLKRKRVFWRGGRTHVQDLMTYMEPLTQIIDEHEDFEFGFVGDTDWPLLDAVEGKKNVRIYEAQDVVEYHRTYKGYGAQVAWAPLQYNLFNQSKSMCAWLEATYAGAAFLGPDFEEYQRPGIANYHDPSTFYSEMTELLANPDKCMDLQEQSIKTIKSQNLELKDTAKTRIELLRQYS